MNTSESETENGSLDEGTTVLSIVFNIILFFFVAGMTATTSVTTLVARFRFSPGLLLGLLIQFVLSPLFAVLTLSTIPHNLIPEEQIVLVVILSSPGGTYSNLLCSMFNADLALSVAMSAVSTLAALFFLPLNIYLYVNVFLDLAAEVTIDWAGLVQTVAAVEGGVALGAYVSWKLEKQAKRDAVIRNALESQREVDMAPVELIDGVPSKKANLGESDQVTQKRKWTNRLTGFGNLCGVMLFVISISLSQSSDEGGLASTDPFFYVTCGLPVFIAGFFAICSSTFFRLEKPTRLSIAVESMYQNTAISSGVALSSFDDNLARVAIGVGVVNGLFQFVGSAATLLVGWRMGWTYAPRNSGLRKLLVNNYQP